MSITIENLAGLEKKVSVVLPATDFDSQVEKKFRKVMTTMKLPGFRKGKVPRNVVEAQYGQAIISEVTQDLVSSSLQDAMQEHKCSPLAMPSINIINNARGAEFSYEATFEELPELPEINFSKCSVQVPQAEIGEEDIAAAILSAQQQRADWDESADKAVDGNRVTLDFVGTIDKEEFSGGSATDFVVVLGSARVLPEFEKAVMGKKAGASVKAKVSFPKDYQAEELAGKKAEFAIEIKKVELAKLPEVNAEFIKEHGVESGVLADFQGQLKLPLQMELDKTLSAVRQQRVFDILLKQYKKVLLPVVLVEEELKQLLKKAGKEENSVSHDSKDEVAVEARNRVLLSIICQGLLKEFNLQLDQKKLTAHIKQLSGSYMDEKQFMQWFYSDNNRVEQVKSTVLQMQLIDCLIEKMTSKEEKTTFTKLRQVV